MTAVGQSAIVGVNMARQFQEVLAEVKVASFHPDVVG